MTCVACVNSVEGILKDFPGVKREILALATSLGEALILVLFCQIYFVFNSSS